MQTLRARRRELKMTLADLAAKVGVTGPQLSRIERTGNTSLTTATALERETGVPAAIISLGDTEATDEALRLARAS